MCRVQKPQKFLNSITEIENNTSVAFIGPSGSGKSTILRLMAGLEPPTSGKVLFKDQNIYQLSDQERADIRRRNFGFIFQSFRLFPSLSVFENVQLACEISNIDQSESVALDWLNQVGLIKQKIKNQIPYLVVNNNELQLHELYQPIQV